MTLICWRLAALAALLLGSSCVAASTAEDCLQDLRALPAYLQANDAGAPEHWNEKGAAHFDAALAQAEAAAQGIAEPQDCGPVLNGYLSAWRSRHLGALSVEKMAEGRAAGRTALGAVAGDAPSLHALSRRTLLLTLRSFDPAFATATVDLLRRQHGMLASHPYWVIDVRRNGGGSDRVYGPLMPWLQAHEQVDIGVDYRATPGNAAASEALCTLLEVHDADCQRQMTLEARRMRDAVQGSFVPQQDGPAVRYTPPTPAPGARPRRVAVLMGKACGSSCEQFLLEARQGVNVKLIGQPSVGALDYSNLRLHPLPSGGWMLFYAISRSRRVPELRIDAGGVQPDIYLPAPVDEQGFDEEVKRVQRWLEGGSLSPGAR